MAAPMLCCRNITRFLKFHKKLYTSIGFSTSTNNDEPSLQSKEDKEKEGGLHVSNIAKAFAKLNKIAEQKGHLQKEDDNESFASMIRRSKLLQLGKIDEKVVKGNIVEVYDDNLYIDFGGKFPCVCPRPSQNSHMYYRGVSVKLLLKDFEMTSAFLGSDKHVTLLEADGVLLGIDRKTGHNEMTEKQGKSS